MADDFISSKESEVAGKLAFKHQGIKKYWLHDSVFISSFFDSSSFLIPDTERFIVKLVKRIAPDISDEELRKKAELLIHEESAHYSVHESYNTMLLREGYKIGFPMYINTAIFKFADKYFSNLTNMAITLTIEFFTLIVAKQFVPFLAAQINVDERLKRLWMWHAIEEIEHSSISFDLFVYHKGGYIRRIAAFLFTTFVIFPLANISHLYLLSQNGGLFNFKVMSKGLKMLLGRKGLYRTLLPEWLRFFKPSFHSSEITIDPNIKRLLYHHHIEDELISYFSS